MNNVAKQILGEINQSLYEKLRNEFHTYLRDIEQKDKITEIADKIDWVPLAKLFEMEYIKLWRKMAVPDNIKELKALKNEFERMVLANLKHKLFHSVYIFIKGRVNNDNINAGNLNVSLYEFFESGMYELFRVFDYQFILSSLKKGNDPKIIIRQIEELRKKAKSGEKLLDNGQLGDEEKVFRMIDEQLLKNEKEGRRWSVRAVCDLYASNELNYGKGKARQSELDDFFKRYEGYKKN